MKRYLTAALITIVVCSLLLCSCSSLDASSNTLFAAAANATLDSGFSIHETNSTVSQPIFNEAAREVTFTVTTTEGSAGYVWCRISENLLPDHNDFSKKVTVFLDGDEIDYMHSFDEGTWQLFLECPHGTHEVKLSLPAEAEFLGVGFLVWAVIVVLICASLLAALVFLHRRHATKSVPKPIRHTFACFV